MRLFSEWLAQWEYGEFAEAPEGSIILAGDAYGDAVYVLEPGGRLRLYDSEGNVFDPNAGVLLSLLYVGLTDQILTLG